MTTRWSLEKRIAFRFAFLFAALHIVPFPLGVIPGTGWLARILQQPWEWGVAWTARAILRIPEPAHVNNGSGDSTWHYVHLVLVALLAIAGTIGWSVLDRKRASYARLADATLVVLRYYLGFILLLYGVSKLFEIQFTLPTPTRLDGRIGDMSPMGMLWTFMGSSRPYTVFGGALEIIPGLLLLSRRTAMLGAVAAIAVLTNIVALNFSYDVPVKLFSLELLAYASAIALPQAFRLLVAALGYPVPEVAPRVRMAPSSERARRFARFALLGSFAFVVSSRALDGDRRPAPGPLHGIWQVESFVVDGEPRAPRLDDPVRWRKLVVSRGFVTIRWMSDVRTYYRAEIDATTIRIGGDLLRYARSDDRLVLDGRYQDRELHATLRLEPEPLLTSRGFHWINDEPFNR